MNEGQCVSGREGERANGWVGGREGPSGQGEKSEQGMTWKSNLTPEQANRPAVEQAKETLHKHMTKHNKPSA